MKTITKSALVAATALTAVSLLAKPHGNHGTDILHFTISESFQNGHVEAGAAGSARARQNQQGNANNQTLDFSVNGLTANTSYGLFAMLGDDTNLTAVADITTDGSGNADIHYRSLGNGHSQGKAKSALPAVLNPVSNIRELDLVNTNTIILTADFTAPASLQYLVKRDISSNSVSADLRIKANTSETQFRLNASGLVASANYLLAVNGSLVQTSASDSNGNLDITSQQSGLDILDIHAIALWDSSSNVVVSTTLP